MVLALFVRRLVHTHGVGLENQNQLQTCHSEGLSFCSMQSCHANDFPNFEVSREGAC
jgi:hypothetical protein